mmetsp:Transcript_75391/g.125699  ORF Transcript_75391/g.125699 Transcript_75391/m.125699 type:complete len:207 (-) Transcript_75391:405-1025(-)
MKLDIVLGFAVLALAHSLQRSPVKEVHGIRKCAVRRASTPYPLLVATSVNEEETVGQKWTARINTISTCASILCAIDCTVLPVLLVLLPVASGSALLHTVAHMASAYFVLPIGGAAVTANYVQHRKPVLGLWGLAGLLLIAVANIHLPHGLMSHAVEELLHQSHEVINVLGCALLLSSQWISHRTLHALGKDCGHNHGGNACSHGG